MTTALVIISVGVILGQLPILIIAVVLAARTREERHHENP